MHILVLSVNDKFIHIYTKSSYHYFDGKKNTSGIKSYVAKKNSIILKEWYTTIIMV